jgi:mono/diheme cytochrome c family protein
MIKRVGILFVATLVLLGGLMLFAYDVIKIDWVSFMEIQPSYGVMEKPLPVPADSIPVEGPAYIAGMGAPANPVSADDISVSRGKELYTINCVICHGSQGKGDGPIAAFIVNPPADLTRDAVSSLSDGSIFLTISRGIEGRMPNLNENLTVRERWDVVNYIRKVIQAQQ